MTSTVGRGAGAIDTGNGLTAACAGRKFGFDEATSDLDSLLNDPAIDALVVATRHDSHAALVCQALEAGKHVFVEKPLALNDGDLDRVLETYRRVAEAHPDGPPVLTVDDSASGSSSPRRLSLIQPFQSGGPPSAADDRI